MQVKSFSLSSFDAGTLVGSDIFVLNFRSVLNKYPLGPQPCAYISYHYSDGKDYKYVFVYLSPMMTAMILQTHLCIQIFVFSLCDFVPPQLLKEQIAKHMTVCYVTA